ncbi:hypothetical protein AAMO2058_000397800 [Amorphochlora amoebiformis]
MKYCPPSAEPSPACSPVTKRDRLEETQENPSSSVRTTPKSGTGKDEFKIGSVIGLGTYGEVRRGMRVSDGQPVAIKLVDLSSFGEEATTMMTKEIKILRSLDHPNVAHVLSVANDVLHRGNWCDACACSDFKADVSGTKCALCGHGVYSHASRRERRPVLMVALELGARGELYRVIEEHGALNEPTARFFFRQLCAGLQHCHARGIVHRDVKPENLVIAHDFTLKIVDFGLAVHVPPDGLLRCGIGSLPYTAPEAYYSQLCEGQSDTQGGYHGEPADVWSCGVVLYVMLTGHHPFQRPLLRSLGSAPHLQACNHFRALMRGDGYYSTPVGGRALLSEIFVLEPSKRPNLKSIAAHTWFSGKIPEPREIEAIFHTKRANRS